MWQRAIGNDLQLTPQIYTALVRASTSAPNDNDDDDANDDDDDDDDNDATNKDSGVDNGGGSARLIAVDLPRTLPQLGAFKRGAMRRELQVRMS